MKIKLKDSFVYTGKQNIPHEAKYQISDLIRFEMLTGNQILLNMKNYEYFRNSEKAYCWFYLSKTKGSNLYDWDSHELASNAIENTIKHINEFSSQEFALIVNAFEVLKIKNEEFWSHVGKNFKKHHPSLLGDHFSYVFLPLINSEYVGDNLKEEMVDLMPRE